MAAGPQAGDLTRASIRGLAMFIVALAAMIFIPVWSVAYWQGWAYLAVFAGSTVAITAYFLRHDPDLIRRRLGAGAGAEAERTQKIIQSVASVCFIATFVISALDYRFGWSRVPAALSLVADVAAAIGFYGVFRTFRENTFAAGTIQVDTEQRVVSTGPYAIVRHPMYAAAGLMVLATPLALGSWWGLLPALALMAAIVLRLLDEERFLILNLPGYARYLRRTPYRLLPRVW
jgi:protein-S-isoprenylcysteine O-methyltransferase Ste14